MDYFKRWPRKAWKEKGLSAMTITELNKLRKAYKDDRQAEESNCDGDGQKRIDWYNRRIHEINQELNRRQS